MERTPGIRPRPGLRHMLDVASRYAFPAAQMGIVLIFLSLPLGIPGQAALQPVWAAINVFFWSVFRPSALPPPVVFAEALLLDLLTQGPIGIQVLLLLLLQAVALRYRRGLARGGFVLVWFVFAIFAAGAAFGEWVLVSLLTWRLLPPWPALFECGLAAGLYPLLAGYLTLVHRGPAAPERAS